MNNKKVNITYFHHFWILMIQIRHKLIKIIKTHYNINYIVMLCINYYIKIVKYQLKQK